MTAEGSASTRGRRIAFTVVTLIFAAASLGGLFGIGLVIGWTDQDMAGIHRVHDIAFGVLYGVILTAAFAALAWKPETRPSAFFQVVVVSAAGLVATTISLAPSYLFAPLSVAIAAAILLALHPSRRTVFHPTSQPSSAMLAFVAVGTVPLLWLALTTARLQRTGPPADPHVSMDHWVNMSAMAFGLVLVGALASCRFEGWRLTAWCAGLGLAVYGLASMVFHEYPATPYPYPGSEGTAWGLAACVGGLAFVAIAELERRRDARPRDTSGT